MRRSDPGYGPGALPTLVLDFDGVVVEEGHWPAIGPIMPGAVEAIQYLSQFYRPVVQTARIYPYNLDGALRPTGSAERDLRMIRDVLDGAGLRGVLVHPVAKLPGLAYVDDRGVPFPSRKKAWIGLVPKLLAKLGIKDEETLYPDFVRKGEV